MYTRFSKIDDLTRPDHTFLSPEDECFYLGEYTARGGFAASPTNDLILNLKKPMDRRSHSEWKYKGRAIRTVVNDLRKLLGQQGAEAVTYVPVPPSVAKDDSGYDDRLLKVLTAMSEGYDTDIRELVLQRETMQPSHGLEERASINELVENYYVDETLTDPPRNNSIVIFDDVLTTGRHFKAMQIVISQQFPDVKIYGVFVARRVPKTDDLENFF